MRHAVLSRPVRRRFGRFCVPIAATLLTVMAASTPATAATVVTQTSWGGTGTDDATAVAAAPDGGSYLTGRPPSGRRAPVEILPQRGADLATDLGQRQHRNR